MHFINGILKIRVNLMHLNFIDVDLNHTILHRFRAPLFQ